MKKEEARTLLELAIELRLRTLLQLHAMSSQEFHTTELAYTDREIGETNAVRIIGEGDRTDGAF